MNVLDLSDSAFAARLSLTLLHSLWQIAILALAASIIERCYRTRSAQWNYTLHVMLLCVGVAAAGLTYAWLDNAHADSRTVFPTTAVEHDAVAEFLPPHAAATQTDPPGARFSSPPTTALSGVKNSLSWRQSARWIIAGYFLGVTTMLLRLLAAIYCAHRLANQATALKNGPLLSSIRDLARRWSLRAMPLLAETEAVVVPRVVGLVRPLVLLPAAAVSGLAFDELELILAHELAHVRRHDMWVVFLQRLAEAALFFNPALWYLSRRISTLREYCCDDLACGASERPDTSLRYSAALVRLIEIAAPESLTRVNPVLLAAGGRSPSELRCRVARLLGEPLREPLRMTRGATAAAVICLMLTLLPFMANSNDQVSDASDAAEQSDRAPDSAKQRFSFGGKVEVLALGTHGLDENRWWDADGKPLKSLPDPLVGCLVRQTDEQGKPLDALPIAWKPGADSVSAQVAAWRRIIMRIRDLPDDADVRWNAVGAQATGRGEISVEGESHPKGYVSEYFGILGGQKTTRVTVGVATGQWKTEGEAQPFGVAAIGKQDRGIVFSEGFDTPNGAAVIVSHDYFDKNVRVVAVDKQGRVHESTSRGGATAFKVHQTRATFANVKRDEIDHFAFQTRDYEYIETAPLSLETPEMPAKDAFAARSLDIVIAEHVIVWDGRIRTWDEVVAELREIRQAKGEPIHPHFHFTNGAHAAEHFKTYQAKAMEVYRELFEPAGMSYGSISPRAGPRYDAIRKAEDLVTDPTTLRSGIVVEKGKPQTGVLVVLVPEEGVMPVMLKPDLTLRDPHDEVWTVTGADGHFTLPVQPARDADELADKTAEPTYKLAAISRTGYRLAGVPMEGEETRIELLPLAYVQLTPVEGKKQRIDLMLRGGLSDASPGFSIYEVELNDEARLLRLPAGKMTVLRAFLHEHGSQDYPAETFEIGPGASRKIRLPNITEDEAKQKWIEASLRPKPAPDQPTD